MTRIEPVLLLVAALAILLCGCSSNPSSPEKDAASVTPAKPQFDFGATDLSPTNGSGMEATLRITIKPASQKPALLGVLINELQNGGDACYVFRNLATNDNMLVADAGAGSIPLGNKKSVANRQCELLHEGTDSSEDTSGTTATFHIRFKPAFRGAKHIWVAPSDGAGNGPALKQVGDWNVQ